MSRCLTILLVASCLLIQPGAVEAQIPNGSKLFAGWRKLRTARVNRFGNNPQRERPPLTKAIGDPANLEEGTPEIIKKAAEVKQAEDAKAQKIKAIKYLVSIGCGCYDKDDSITQALIAAAGDCTEQVRLVTMKALLEAACGEKCEQCGTGCCCKEPMIMQLYKMAYERDDKGNYLEPSARVREAAMKALRACCQGTGPVEITEPEPTEPKTRIPDETAPLEDETLPDENGDPAEDEPAVEDEEQEVLHRGFSAAGTQGKINPSDLEYGVIIDLDRDLRIAHVHFRNGELQFPEGAKLMAVVERDSKNYWVGPLTVYKSFTGSAHVTASNEMAWNEIRKGTPIVSTSTQALGQARVAPVRFAAKTDDSPAAPEPNSSTSQADGFYSTIFPSATRVRR